MPAAGFLRFQYLAWIAKPVAHRAIYWSMRSLKPRSIVQLGVGKGEFASNLLDVALRFSPEVSYTGVDLFEGREDTTTGLALKDAHKLLAGRGAKVKLAPGEPFPVLSRIANTLPNTDLLVISADQNAASLEQAWFFVPRMLQPHSAIFVEDSAGSFRRLNLSDITALANTGRQHRRRAA